MDSVTVGWIGNEKPNSKGGFWNSRNFKSTKPDNVEIVDINPLEPQECHIYAVHSDVVPKNLPLFPKTFPKGKSRLRPVVVYANGMHIDAFGASHVIYQSPLHALAHKFGKKHIIPPPILESDYTYDGAERKPAAMWLGEFHPDDGIDICIRWSEVTKNSTDYYGYNVPTGTVSTPHASFKGEPDPAALPGIYNSYEKFIFFARSPQPFNRCLAEAALAGCEVIYSGPVGMDSFDKPVEAVIEDCKGSAQVYWDYLLELV